MLFQEQIKTVKQAAPELAATTNEQRSSFGSGADSTAAASGRDF